MDDMLYNLIRLTQPAVYALVNEVDRYAYVSQSNNPMKAISVLLEDIENNRNAKLKALIRDKDKLKLKIIKSTGDSNQRKLDLEHYVDSLYSQGYKLYNRYKGVKYRLVNQIVKFKVHLYLVNRRNDRKLIGVFDSFKEMNEFIQLYYTNIDMNKFYEVHSLNKATQRYYKRLKVQKRGKFE